MRIDAKWVNDILEEGDECATLPFNVKPDIFSQVAFDNAEYGQENNSQHITIPLYISIQTDLLVKIQSHM